MRKVFAIALLVAACISCAKQGYPSGGPKDEAPPTVVSATPTSESKNIRPSRFTLYFDEYVVANDMDNNVIVSPPLKYKPEFEVKGRKLVANIKDTLQENTTYLFQFCEAVGDFTEGNKLKRFDYVFSTGEGIDTMKLAGVVKDASTGKPRKERVTVLAFSEDRCESDTVALSQAPDRVTRCNERGEFLFTYIPTGDYRLVAIEDVDRNQRYGESEAVGWTMGSVPAVDSIDSVLMVEVRMSDAVQTKQRVVKAELAAKGRLVLRTAMPMRTKDFNIDRVADYLNARGDSLVVWLKDKDADSLRFVFSDLDFTDTLFVKYKPPVSKGRKGRQSVAAKEPLVKPLCDGNKAYYDQLELSFTNPIQKVKNGAVEVMDVEDSVWRSYEVEKDMDGLSGRVATVLQPNHKYVFRIGEGVFTDIYGDVNDSLRFDVLPKDYGTLAIRIKDETRFPLVVEVVDGKDSVRQNYILYNNGVAVFKHLDAQEYRVRAFWDEDKNGEWSKGNYREQKQPEMYVYFPKVLKLREGWEIEEQWESPFGMVSVEGIGK